MKYKLTAKAYGAEAGDTVTLDQDDPLVQLNATVGILIPDEEVRPNKMTCPICTDTMKRPPKLDSPDELAAHYEDKHPGFAVPPWSAETEGSEQ